MAHWGAIGCGSLAVAVAQMGGPRFAVKMEQAECFCGCSGGSTVQPRTRQKPSCEEQQTRRGPLAKPRELTGEGEGVFLPRRGGLGLKWGPVGQSLSAARGGSGTPTARVEEVGLRHFSTHLGPAFLWGVRLGPTQKESGHPPPR